MRLNKKTKNTNNVLNCAMYLLVFSICSAFILSTGFLYRYGNIPRQHPLVTVSVLFAWSFSFLIVFTIPLDITAVSRIISFYGESSSPHLLFISQDRLSPMLVWTQHHRWQQHHRSLPEALGHGVGWRVSKSLANHLLDLTISHMAHYAANAVLPQSRGFSHAGKIAVGSDRQRNILRNLLVHLRLSAHLHSAEAWSHFRLAEVESNRIVSIKHLGSFSSRSSSRLW